MNLIILGATARAAAWSAVRAGMTPYAAAFFNDRDLQAVATSVRISSSFTSQEILRALQGFPDAPWIFTGPLENEPDLIERLRLSRTLLGIAGTSLTSVRNPRVVAARLEAFGLRVPEVHTGDPTSLPKDGSWLSKPIASAGGIGVAHRVDDRMLPGPVYYQKFIAGLSLSAIFIGTRTGSILQGVTRQLTGIPGNPFEYRGSIGPWPVSAEVGAQIQTLGITLGREFSLVGLFGVDLILDADAQIWPVEINPRYTASVEVLELALQRSLLAAHRRACEDLPIDAAIPCATRFVGKEVLFATKAGVFEESVEDPNDPWRVPEFADIPEFGTRFKAGEPVMTVLAESATIEECQRVLAERRTRRPF